MLIEVNNLDHTIDQIVDPSCVIACGVRRSGSQRI